MLRSAPFWYGTFPRFAHTILRMYGANYEREMELLDALCDPARTGIDVGAKVGMYTYRIRDRSSDVICFDPVPLFRQMLERVFEPPLGRIEPYALSNRRGYATLRMPYRANGGAEFGRSTIEPANRLAHETVDRAVELQIETRTLDEYGLHNVGFIKIDVEGHELAVLDGAEQTVASSRPNMLVECNEDHQPDGVAHLARWLVAAWRPRSRCVAFDTLTLGAPLLDPLTVDRTSIVGYHPPRCRPAIPPTCCRSSPMCSTSCWP